MSQCSTQQTLVLGRCLLDVYFSNALDVIEAQIAHNVFHILK